MRIYRYFTNVLTIDPITLQYVHECRECRPLFGAVFSHLCENYHDVLHLDWRYYNVEGYDFRHFQR